MHRPLSALILKLSMVGGMLYMSGQIALIPETGEVVDEGVEAQTIRVLQNMEGVLTEAGLTFADIVKTTVSDR